MALSKSLLEMSWFLESGVPFRKAAPLLTQMKMFNLVDIALSSGKFFKDRVANNYSVILPSAVRFLPEGMSPAKMDLTMKRVVRKSRVQDWHFKIEEVGGISYSFWKPEFSDGIVRIAHLYDSEIKNIIAMFLQEDDRQQLLLNLKAFTPTPRTRKPKPVPVPAPDPVLETQPDPVEITPADVTASEEFIWLNTRISDNISPEYIAKWVAKNNLVGDFHVEWKRYYGRAFQEFIEHDFPLNGYRDGKSWPSRDHSLDPLVGDHANGSWVKLLVQESDRVWSFKELTNHFNISQKELRSALNKLSKTAGLFITKSEIGPADKRSESNIADDLFSKFISFDDVSRYKGAYRKILATQQNLVIRLQIILRNSGNRVDTKHIWNWAFDKKIVLDETFIKNTDAIKAMLHDLVATAQNNKDVALVKEQERERQIRLTLTEREVGVNPKIGTGKTWKEAEKLMEQEYPSIVWDFKNLHPDIANTMSREFAEIAQEWPNAFDQMRYIGSLRNRDKVNDLAMQTKTSISKIRWNNAFGMATTDRKAILLNPNKMNSAEEYEKIRQYSSKVGFNAASENATLADTLTHEMGHHVDFWMTAHEDIYVCKYADSMRPHLFSLHTLITAWKDMYGNRNSMQDISEYAKTNKYEAWAETFLAWRGGKRIYKSHIAVIACDEIMSLIKPANLHTKIVLLHTIRDPAELEAAQFEIRSVYKKLSSIYPGY